MDKHIIIFEHDIQKYPPVLYLINYLISIGKDIEVFSGTTDEELLTNLQSKGVKFNNIINNDIYANKLKKINVLRKFKSTVLDYMSSQDPDNVTLWMFGESCIWLIGELVYKFKSILYLFEIPNFSIKVRYKILSPKLNYQSVLQSAFKIVCCEYNRAHITRAYFNLEVLPTIIPNKPYLIEETDSLKVSSLLGDVRDKKIILYQGIFNYPERKMENLCESINYLPENFIVCLMGSENDYKKKLEKTYKSDRIRFIPYIKAPLHLEITKQAYIGYLTYSPEVGNIKNVLNTLFCAPNKIFEYSKFKIPMLSNDVPALKYIFTNYGAGEVFKSSPQDIAEMILKIDQHYNEYSLGSESLFESVNLEHLYQSLIE